MEHEFWRKRWQDQQIGFHQAEINPALQRIWPTWNLAKGGSVFVPLCGKTLDMTWLASQGHKVVGVELSEIAIDDFYAERGLTPTVREHDGFIIKSAENYELWIGDFFAFPKTAVTDMAGIYDRASLIALPPDMRARYAEKLIELNTSHAPTLLLTIEYDQTRVQGPPFSVPRTEVETLFTPAWTLTELKRGDAKMDNPKFRGAGMEVLTGVSYRLAPK